MSVFSSLNGKPFGGTEEWWSYILAQDEQQRLDYLICAALLNSNIREQLLRCDEQLLTTFQFSDNTCCWLRGLAADSIETIACAIVARYTNQ